MAGLMCGFWILDFGSHPPRRKQRETKERKKRRRKEKKRRNKKETKKKNKKTKNEEEENYSKKGPLHVRLHVVVVKRHDFHQCLKGCHLHTHSSALSGLTDNLHDVVPLTLVVEVLTNKLERVEQGGQGRLAHLTFGMKGKKRMGQPIKRFRERQRTVLRLVAASSRHDCGEDLVGLGRQNVGVLQVRVNLGEGGKRKNKRKRKRKRKKEKETKEEIKEEIKEIPTISSQMKPMVSREARLRLTLEGLLVTLFSRREIRSFHWP